MHRWPRWAAAAAAFSLCAIPGATMAQESACAAPGLTVLTDAEGDWSGGNTSGVGTAEMDLLSLQVAEAGENLHFRIKVAGIAALPPNGVWYTSFETAEGLKYGVRMASDDTGAVTYFSYLVAPGGLNNDGASDGRFVEDGSEIPAISGSYDADGNIDIVVKAENVGAFPGDTLGPFNAAYLQTADLVAVRFAGTFDQMPDSLGRDGFFELGTCDEGSKFLGIAVGALPAGSLALLGLLALAGLRRRALRGQGGFR